MKCFFFFYKSFQRYFKSPLQVSAIYRAFSGYKFWENSEGGCSNMFRVKKCYICPTLGHEGKYYSCYNPNFLYMYASSQSSWPEKPYLCTLYTHVPERKILCHKQLWRSQAASVGTLPAAPDTKHPFPGIKKK